MLVNLTIRHRRLLRRYGERMMILQMYRLAKVPLRRLWWIFALVIGSLVLWLGTDVPAAPSTHSVLTLKEFQRQPFSLILPVVPTSMVAAPPNSRAHGVETRLPTQVLRALYYKSENPIFGPPPGLGPHPIRATILVHLPGAVGPARVYTVPHRQAIFWVFEGAILQAQHTPPNPPVCPVPHRACLPVQPSVPVGWQTFIRAMSQHSRIVRTVHGMLGAAPTLPKAVPNANAWTVAVYHRANPKKMPYLSQIDIVVHQNTVWVLFRGIPKIQVAPNTQVPSALVSVPHGTATVEARQVPAALRAHFDTLFTANPWLPYGTPNMAGSRWSARSDLTTHSGVRVYHGIPTKMDAWLSIERKTLNALNAPDSGVQGTWHGIRWISIRYGVPNTATPWFLWIFVTPQGWTAIAAGP